MKHLPSEFVQNVTIYQQCVEIRYMTGKSYLVLISDMENFCNEKITEDNKYELAEKYNESLFKLE